MEYIFLLVQKWRENRKELWNEEFKRKKNECKEMAFWGGSNEFFYL